MFQQGHWHRGLYERAGAGRGSPHGRHYQGSKCPSASFAGSASLALSPGHCSPGTDGKGRTRDHRPGVRTAQAVAGHLGLSVPGAAGLLLFPIPGRAAGIKQAAEPERVLISGRQLLGITLTEWFCLPAFSTVRRPRAMDQRRGSSSGGGCGCTAHREGWLIQPDPPFHSLTAPTPAWTQVGWAPRTRAQPSLQAQH